MNIVVTQTAINASVSDQNISVSAPQFSISASVVSSDIYASLSQTQINASVSQPPNVGVSLPQTPISVAVSSNGGGNNHDPVTLGIANGLSLSGQVLSLALSATGTVGALSAIDYNTFNGKLSDAPSNGLIYGRNNGAWVNITGTGGSSLPVVDTTAIVMGSSDPTKLLRFEVDGFSAGATRILTPPNQNATIAGLEVAQTFIANQTMSAHVAIGADATISSTVLVISETITDSSSTDTLTIAGMNVNLEVRPSSDASQTNYRAAEFFAITLDGDNQPINVLNGFVALAEHDAGGTVSTVVAGLEAYSLAYGSGNIVTMTGLYSYVEPGGSGNVSNVFGASYEVWMTGASAITNVTGQRILFVKTGGTVTNAIGLDISNVNFGTSINIAIRTNAGNIIFNESGDANTDVRFESDTDANMFYMDGGNNAITIGSTTELAKFGIDGNADEKQFVVQGHSTQTNDLQQWQKSDATVYLRVQGDGDLEFDDGVNIIFDTTTGTKIGTATSQKLSFWNASPIVQPTTAVAEATFVANAGTAVNDASTFDGYTIKQFVKALRNTGLLA